VTALTQTVQIPPDSVRLCALQVVVSKVEAQASDAAFEGTVAGAIAEGFSEGGGALIATQPRQTGDDASAKWVPHRRKDDRKHRRRLFCRNGGYGSPRDNNVDLAPDELGRDLGETLVVSLRPRIFDRDGAALEPAK
jgi:hypothetical protein